MTMLLDELPSGSSRDPLQNLQPSLSTPSYNRLPRLELPKFNGDHTEWLTFKDLFSSLVINNETLSAVEKLFYLKSNLTGSASLLLKHTPLTGNNFQKAWEDLSSYYDNNRILVDSTLHSLFSMKCLKKESASELEELYTTVQQNIRSLEILDQPVKHWDSILIYLTIWCLYPNTVRAWELELGSSTACPKWSQLGNFIVSRMRSLQALDRASTSTLVSQNQSGHKPNSSSSSSRQTKSQSLQHTTMLSPTLKGCPVWEGEHPAYKCPDYVLKPVERKIEMIKRKKLCFNCLGSHVVASCPSSRRCLKCVRKHHTSIHSQSPKSSFNQSSSPFQPPSPAETDPEPTVKQAHHVHSSAALKRPSVLLATARAKIELHSGQVIDVRILIDQGSEISLVTEKLVQSFNIPRRQSYLSIVGAGAQLTGKSKGSVDLKLRSNYNPDCCCFMTAEILPRLTSKIPSTKTSQYSWRHLREIELAEPQLGDSSPVDIILGADVYHQIIQTGLKRGKKGGPIAQLTIFGWILSGPVDEISSSRPAQGYHCSCEKKWYDLIEGFWRQDEVSTVTPSLSPADQECENLNKSTHTRSDSGRYVVRLPFKSSGSSLEGSKVPALNALNRLFRKFDSNPSFRKEYENFLNEYEELGHMKLVPPDSPEPIPVNYLPHHGIFSNSDDNPKLRVVFNGSSKSSDGTSLNDLLHTGAKLQTDLNNVLLWFRKFRIVFSTDIQKMYRQIMVHSDDWSFQRILWRDSLGNVMTYNLTTVTYGLACAPFLALRSINQLIEDEGTRFPLAVTVLRKGRYVDDIFGGGDSVEEVQQIAQEVTQLCMAGGFPLRKWISNCPAVLDRIPPNYQLPVDSVPIDQPTAISALGLSWQPSNDVFTFSPSTLTAEPFTKRSISSKIARLFDPLGFIAPVTITGKIILQRLWAVKVGWDEPIPENVVQKWVQFITQLSDLQKLQFPRWIGITNECHIQIHGFADASQVGMAAVVYLRIGTGENINVSFVCAKTKVAPLKKITIPRLELTAATLLTRLTAYVSRTLDLINSPTFLWTDSSITHTWIQGHPSQWKEYIHNRVCFIQETLPTAQWKLLPGYHNPADCASRGLTSDELLLNTSWCHGPPWLSLTPSDWPCASSSNPSDEILEKRPSVTTNVVCSPSNVSWDLINRYSSLTRLLRITALCQRVVKKFRHSFTKSIRVPLTPEELGDAKYYWVQQTQLEYYSIELTTLSTQENLPKQNSLVRLTPFIDKTGILRVGGRLKNSPLSYENKHPFILPRTSVLSKLIIADAHCRTLHGTTQDTLAYIRTTSWIVGGRAPIRSFILRCVTCSILRRKHAQQRMGQLPFTRVTPVERAFLHTGLDYAGPFTLKTWSGRAAKTYKGYIVLFVCQTTSAIHLEMVTDYTTRAFLSAYQRFVSRRGICKTLASDCGTNLKGADAELKKLSSKASEELGNMASLIANDGTKWLFNPPAAPHFGGKWEAGVKSVKHHLRRVLGDTIVTYEEMMTLVCQIEAVLNSRPLCPLTDDPDDLTVLTPGHFLVGQPLNVTPEPNLEGSRLNRLTRWQRIRHILDTFWTRWSRECLQRYLAVYKWNQSSHTIDIGTIVLIIDERYPPTKWPLGRVMQVHPGKDGLTRVATVKTQTNLIKRPIVKLCPLPIPTNDS